MSNGTPSPSQAATNASEAGAALGKAVHDMLMANFPDQMAAVDHATRKAADALGVSTETTVVVNQFMSLASDLLAAFFAMIGAFRHATTHNFDTTAVEIVNEFLMTEMDSSVMKTSAGGDEAIKKARAIGQAVLGRLEQEFSGTTEPTAGKGATGAATFAGFGVNFAIQNALISLLGSLIPETRLDDIRELGVEVAQNLGLGRLMRVALRPLVQTLIATPYTRELNARYQPNILGDGQLARAWLANRLDQAAVLQWFAQNGLRADHITELIEQTRERLKPEEWNQLVASGQQGDDPAAYVDQANGMDSDWIALRQAVLTGKRLDPVVKHVLNEILSQIRQGFVPTEILRGALDRYKVPADEQLIWIDAAQTFHEVPRKRISEAHMLFLYEASQVTDDELELYLRAEGYSAEDVQRMLTFFRLKFIEATQKGGTGKAAHAEALHLEHIAYVTDEITGLWSRPPTAAELTYWVKLLDSGARTKHDFVTELKALPTTGPAMP